jgi:hypothetical protein
MQRKVTERYNETKPVGVGIEDSPAIQELIKKLDRDLEESQRNDSKAQ